MLSSDALTDALNNDSKFSIWIRWREFSNVWEVEFPIFGTGYYSGASIFRLWDFLLMNVLCFIMALNDGKKK
jgi:hypothetical protein